jgi:hypothetical protein
MVGLIPTIHQLALAIEDGWVLGTLGTSPSASKPEDDMSGFRFDQTEKPHWISTRIGEVAFACRALEGLGRALDTVLQVTAFER